jgi:hypothetical protein
MEPAESHDVIAGALRMRRHRRKRCHRYRQRFSRSQKLFHFVSLRLQAVMQTLLEFVEIRALFACSRS